MRKNIGLVFGMILMQTLAALGAVLWSEDFEGATLGATSGSGATLAGTVIQTANTASSIVVDSTSDPAAAAVFSLASGKFIRLSTDANPYTAIRSSLDPISFGTVSPTNTYTLSFDIYIPSALSKVVGDIQPRFELNGVGGSSSTDSTFSTADAGQHHIVYTGLISDFIGTDVDEARPFIGIDQGGVVLADYLYMDNIHFEIGGGDIISNTSNMVEMDSYTSDAVITQDEFSRAQQAAGSGGIIRLSARTYKVTTALLITQKNLSIIGAGRNRTIIRNTKTTKKTDAIIKTDQDGTRLQQLTLESAIWPTFATPLAIKEGGRAVTGVEAGVRVNDGALNFKVVDVMFYRVNVGIEFDVPFAPDGLEVWDCFFITGRGMINAHDGGNTLPLKDDCTMPMIIDHADYVYHLGQGCRGITLDFGNSSGFPLVDMKGSVIQNSSFDRVTNFTIDVNRAKNMTIQNNVINGGGAGVWRSRYVHSLHFEDHSSDILIKGNRLHQNRFNDAGLELALRSHVHGTADNVTMRSNTMTGWSSNGALIGLMLNWTLDSNVFNMDTAGFSYIINCYQSPSSFTLLSGNTVNGVALKKSQVKADEVVFGVSSLQAAAPVIVEASVMAISKPTDQTTEGWVAWLEQNLPMNESEALGILATENPHAWRTPLVVKSLVSHFAAKADVMASIASLSVLSDGVADYLYQETAAILLAEHATLSDFNAVIDFLNDSANEAVAIRCRHQVGARMMDSEQNRPAAFALIRALPDDLNKQALLDGALSRWAVQDLGELQSYLLATPLHPDLDRGYEVAAYRLKYDAPAEAVAMALRIQNTERWERCVYYTAREFSRLEPVSYHQWMDALDTTLREEIVSLRPINETGVPVMAVRGGVMTIVNGDPVSSAGDRTHLGHIPVGVTNVQVYTIFNRGDTALNLTNTPLVQVSGSSDFSILSQPASGLVPVGGSVDFSVQFIPSVHDETVNTTVRIVNDDAFEGPYTFVLEGRAPGLLTAKGTPTLWLVSEGLANATTEDYEEVDLLDQDGDGMPAWKEYVAGTGPNDSSDYFSIAPIENRSGEMVMGFGTTLSRSYTVEVADDLMGEWALLTNGISGTGERVEFVDSESVSNRFYRLKVELQ